MTYALTPYMLNFGNNYDLDYLDTSTFSVGNNVARARSAVCVPATFVTSIIDTLAGTLEGILVGLPAALLHEMGIANDAALTVIADPCRRISHSNRIIAEPFKRLLQTINPKVLRGESCKNYDRPCISAKGIGFIANQVHIAVNYLTTTENSLYRHIISRLVCALAPIAYIIARIADGIIGLAVAPFALLLCGRWESLNNLAYRGLQAPGIIFDLYRCAIRFITPPPVTPSDL